MAKNTPSTIWHYSDREYIKDWGLKMEKFSRVNNFQRDKELALESLAA